MGMFSLFFILIFMHALRSGKPFLSVLRLFFFLLYIYLYIYIPLYIYIYFWDSTSCQAINCCDLAMCWSGCCQQTAEWHPSKNVDLQNFRSHTLFSLYLPLGVTNNEIFLMAQDTDYISMDFSSWINSVFNSLICNLFKNIDLCMFCMRAQFGAY